MLSMKKFLYLAIAALALFAIQSCKNETFELTYDFTIDGRANGDVDVSFPGGTLDLTGKTDLAFNYGNMAPTVAAFYTLAEASASEDPTIRQAANLINSTLEEQFSASSATGTYYLHVYGTVQEKLTSVKISFDKVFTNEKPGLELKE